MDEELQSTIETLRQALQVSPDNTPLRNLYVQNLIKAGMTADAVNELIILLQHEPDNPKNRLLLAELYYQREESGKGIVILEDLIARDVTSPEVFLLYVRLLIQEENLTKAADVYREYILPSKTLRDESIEALLQDVFLSDGMVDEMTFPDDVDSHIIEKPKIKFDDVGGMASVKEEIAFKIIRPMQHKELFSAYGKQPGGGILMYGPPGCGKTYISRATAGETGSVYISVGIHEVLDMYIGQSENKLHSIFNNARRNAPSVLFFDEADALGASRTDMKNYSGRHLINQFLMELDGDRISNEGVLILASTNTPWNLDPAFLRPGRFDRIIFVPPPDYEARVAILHLLIKGKPAEGIDYKGLAKKTADFSGADLAGLVDVAVETLLREVLRSGSERPLVTKDIEKALKTVRPSTREWFATARNYVTYSNEGGLYNAVRDYLENRK